MVSNETFIKNLPIEENQQNLPMVINNEGAKNDFSEREILYKVLFDMRNDITEMKRVIVDLMKNNNLSNHEKSKLIS